MKRVLIFLICIMSINRVFSQDSLFLKVIDSPGAYSSEEIEAVIQTSDLGIVSAGFSDGFSVNGDGDGIVIKTNLNGQIEWIKVYGDTTSNMAIDIKETSDGSFIFGGWTMTGGNYDFWVVKLDSTGNIQWEKRFGGSGDDQVWSVDVASDGYLVVGGTNSFGAGLTDVWVIKLDFNGSIIWQKTYGTSGDDAPPGAYQEYVARGFVDVDGNFVISSITDGAGHGGTDIFVIKLNSSDGSIIWQYAYGDIEDDVLWSFVKSRDGNGYYLPGNTINPSTLEGDLWVVRINTSGNIIWQKIFGIAGKWDEALNACSTPDGILLGSYFETGAQDWSASVIKVTGSGNFQWAKKYKVGHLDWTNDLKQLDDNTIIIGGVTTDTTTWNEDYLFIRTDSSGNIPGCNYITDFVPDITVTNTTRIAVNFTVTSTNVTALPVSSTQTDISPALTTICGATMVEERSYKSEKERVSVFPNPVRENFFIKNLQSESITIKIYDISYREIKKVILRNNENRVDVRSLTPGIYYIRINNKEGKRIYSGKIIKLR